MGLYGFMKCLGPVHSQLLAGQYGHRAALDRLYLLVVGSVPLDKMTLLLVGCSTKT